MSLRLKQRKILVPLFLTGLGLALLMAPDKWKQRIDPTRKDAMDGSAYSRINAWTFSWRLVADYPLTGGGFETFTRELFILYAPNPYDVHGPHSIFFGVMAEHGFIGLALYLMMLAACIGSAMQALRWARFQGDEVAANYVYMFSFSLIAFLFSGLFLGRQYFDYMFTILACMIVLKRAFLKKWSAAEAEEPAREEVMA
jgi:probable O-glycosylation ligase (exosortase A-associated)